METFELTPIHALAMRSALMKEIIELEKDLEKFGRSSHTKGLMKGFHKDMIDLEKIRIESYLGTRYELLKATLSIIENDSGTITFKLNE